MQRIPTLLEKLTELCEQEKDVSLIDIDLMMDYTRVLYADLYEMRKKSILTTQPISMPVQATPNHVLDTNEAAVEVMTPEVKYAEVPTNDIRTLIGINDKYLYISDLFNDDKSAYDDAIRHLNTFDNIADANKWVGSELGTKYNWDKENETVQSFYSLLNSCFPSI